MDVGQDSLRILPPYFIGRLVYRMGGFAPVDVSLLCFAKKLNIRISRLPALILINVLNPCCSQPVPALIQINRKRRALLDHS